MIRVATFNAGLAPGYLPHVGARLPHIVDALASLAPDLDVLYVQEVWLDDHHALLRERLASELPHVLRQQPTERPATGGCTREQLEPLLECVHRHCANLRDDALAACVVRHCAQLGLSLPPACINCIASDPRGSIDEIVARCIGPARRDSDALLAYGGSFGTALFSRTPLDASDALVYRSTINARGAVYARTLGLHVFATHLSPGGSDQAPQVDALIAWAAGKAPRNEPALLLGDLNASPVSSLFKALLRAGFREADTLDRRSTWGDGLQTGRATDAGWRIDHILARDLAGYVTTQRILDESVTVEGSPSTLSDHYGVLATIDM